MFLIQNLSICFDISILKFQLLIYGITYSFFQISEAI